MYLLKVTFELYNYTGSVCVIINGNQFERRALPLACDTDNHSLTEYFPVPLYLKPSDVTPDGIVDVRVVLFQLARRVGHCQVKYPIKAQLVLDIKGAYFAQALPYQEPPPFETFISQPIPTSAPSSPPSPSFGLEW